MDRRLPRAIFVIALGVGPLVFGSGPRFANGQPASVTMAQGDPVSSVAGPTTFGAIGPTANPLGDGALDAFDTIRGSGLEVVDTTNLR